ncbi:cyclic 2,3-diphosphoglycerate synthase [Phycicoccus sp. M110.8]|uniref:cyclic 2,3-diphosphoglycerate synthase n=1 Tax=Phycicoccus sp. M110.8 TaxID=3075433 RepID=UPI0028FD2646|nr:cyclic 2,3-diphosphoglycerate synthase [Phycicoccus sp. M110.8]MDU0315318.1 cyclic 2,3-diphosphoglycerate synthase [Phycicoccus sp. M110.8]
MTSTSTARTRVVLLGAAGRDFHDFNVVFRDDPGVEVVAFTATQIPDIEGRRYPAELAGSLYPQGIPVVAESELQDLLEREGVDLVVFAYSDVRHEQVMHLASQCIAAGADFRLHGARRTMLRSSKPVVAVTAVRTGVGKSQTTRYVARLLREQGLRVVAVRHPMPYGDLAAQACQRFATYADLDRYDCTIEEREEYEPHLDAGVVVYAGVDYERILREAEREADVVLWDGGNNDLPFYAPDLHVVLADPLRPGDETAYHPGEANVRMADVVLVAKCDSARPADVEAVEASVRALNPRATVLRAESPVTVDDEAAVRGRRVLVVEDGPTLTHGSMSWGAGVVGARAAGAAEVVDPVPYAVGSIAATYAKYPNARGILPAMGYGAEQVRDLEATIRAAVDAGACDAVVSGTPIDLTRVLSVPVPLVRARYELREVVPGGLAAELDGISRAASATMRP